MAESEAKSTRPAVIEKTTGNICENCKKEGTLRPPRQLWGCYESGHGVMVSFEIAAADGHVECLQELLNAGADVNYTNKENGYTPLMWAARYGKDGCVELLIKAGIDVNIVESHSANALMLASGYAGNIKCVELLLDAGADVNHGDWQRATALMYAASSGHEDIVTLFIQKGADVNAVTKELHDGITAIHRSATTPDGWKCIDVLAKAGADVNFMSDGKTPLMVALQEECDKSIKALIKEGADVNIVDEEHGLTVLHQAVQMGDEMYKVIIEAGADVNVKSPQGHTPLMHAMDDREYDCVETLIQAGADVNITCDDANSTALFWAGKMETSWRKSVECAKLLLRSGARINVRNNKGHNALEETLSWKSGYVGESSLTLFAAGETINVNRVRQPSSKVRTQGHLSKCFGSSKRPKD